MRWLSVILATGATVLAAAPTDKGDEAYRDFVRRVNAGDLSLDFRAFRLACLNVSTCDPRGDNKDLISMQRSLQSKDYRKAVKTGEALIEHGYVNIQAHVVCSQAYGALKNPEKDKFHHDVAAALIRSIMATGTARPRRRHSR